MGLGHVRLVESDQRKCAFLSEARRLAEAEATVLPARVETLSGPAATITARAFAPLSRLLDLTAPLIGSETVFWLWKGQDVEVELTQAAKCWNMTVERYPSLSDPRGTILHLREVSRA
jgi:16S rRNA (guanine527-N7)-methyltransferase